MAQPLPAATGPAHKRRLSLLRILEMNLGFFGLQFAFGLQQGQMAPILSWLGAGEARLPMLQLAGPVTGLLVQPLVGALSDATCWRLGRRLPYVLAGAVLTSLGLALMPFSTSLLMAASLLWLIDAGANTTMEPYRAYIADRLDAGAQPTGFLVQAAFTGLAQSLAYLTPSLLLYQLGVSGSASAHHLPAITRASFLVGAVLSLATVTWSVWRVPEEPLPPADRLPAGAPLGAIWNALRTILRALCAMPAPMRQLAAMSLFQWYGAMIYWSYVALAIGRTAYATADKTSAAFRAAVLASQQLGAVYNLVACAAGFAMVPLARRLGAGRLHRAAMVAMGLGLLALPLAGAGSNAAPPLFSALALAELGRHLLLLGPALGLGLGWASMMGLPPLLVARAVPRQQIGVYMGLYNGMIVVPMLLHALSFGWVYRVVLGGDPARAIALAGMLMLAAALATPAQKR